MSTQQGSNRPEGEKSSEGLSKYIKRMRTVLRRSSTAKTSSVSSMHEVTGGESSRDVPAKPTAEPTPAAPTTTTSTSTSTSTPAPAQKQQPAKNTQTAEPTVISPWSSLQQEKARTLFAKYGLTLEPGEWKSPSDMTVQRVNKPIRMRVRRTCHRCQTTFGPDKVCVNCQHARCKKCPRHPPLKSQPSQQQQQQQQQQQPELTMKARIPERKTRTRDPHGAPVVATCKVREGELTIPSRTGGQDLVRRPARQRVRRNCHLCGNLFPTADATECIGCGHIRCKKCPRDPPKLHKYPDGYPGDAEPPIEMPQRQWRKPRQRVRYTCHICSSMYRAGERSCSGCGQERGPQTLRDPPKKMKPDADPEIVKRVQERLAQLDIIA